MTISEEDVDEYIQLCKHYKEKPHESGYNLTHAKALLKRWLEDRKLAIGKVKHG